VKLQNVCLREGNQVAPARTPSHGQSGRLASGGKAWGYLVSPGLALRDCGRPRASGLRTLSLSVMVEDKVVWTDNLHAPVPRFWSEMLAALRRALPHA